MEELWFGEALSAMEYLKNGMGPNWRKMGIIPGLGNKAAIQEATKSNITVVHATTEVNIMADIFRPIPPVDELSHFLTDPIFQKKTSRITRITT